MKIKQTSVQKINLSIWFVWLLCKDTISVKELGHFNMFPQMFHQPNFQALHKHSPPRVLYLSSLTVSTKNLLIYKFPLEKYGGKSCNK